MNIDLQMRGPEIKKLMSSMVQYRDSPGLACKEVPPEHCLNPAHIIGGQKYKYRSSYVQFDTKSITEQKEIREGNMHVHFLHIIVISFEWEASDIGLAGKEERVEVLGRWGVGLHENRQKIHITIQNVFCQKRAVLICFVGKYRHH